MRARTIHRRPAASLILANVSLALAVAGSISVVAALAWAYPLRFLYPLLPLGFLYPFLPLVSAPLYLLSAAAVFIVGRWREVPGRFLAAPLAALAVCIQPIIFPRLYVTLWPMTPVLAAAAAAGTPAMQFLFTRRMMRAVEREARVVIYNDGG